MTSNKEILKLAGPIVLGNISQMALGLIDTAMVGQVGAKLLQYREIYYVFLYIDI